MKKVLLLLFCCILCFSAGCGAKSDISKNPPKKTDTSAHSQKVSGTVTYEYGAPGYGVPVEFGVSTSNDGYYGFITDENTKLIWKDTKALDSHSPQHNEWALFGCSMEVTVTYGEEAKPSEPLAFERAVGCYKAEKVVVTKVLDSYFEAPAKPVI